MKRLRAVSAPAVPAGIYGTIICASILATAGNEPAGMVALVVLGTLFVYWLAERYSEVLALAEHEHPGRGSGRWLGSAHVRHVLGSGWPMIEASVTPLLVLLACRVLGASSQTAVDIALAYTVVLLFALGWLAATRAGLSGGARLVATAFASFLGLLVVVLKMALH